MKKDKYYIVTAYRWGDREKHSYVVGIFGKKHAAIKTAENHREYRGGKYECQVLECSCLKKQIIDEYDRFGKPVYGESI